MDNRRSLIPLAPLLLATSLGACAHAPAPLSALVSQRPLQLVPRQAMPVLMPVALPQVRWASCAPVHRRKGGARVVRKCTRQLVALEPRSTSKVPSRAILQRLPTPLALAAAPPLPMIRVAYVRPAPASFPVQAYSARPPAPAPAILPPAPQPPRPAAMAAPSRVVRVIAAPVSTDRREGAIDVFAYTPGRVYQVRAAPLRVTTLQLQPGETLIDKAAGDTVRWAIGETTSGSGDSVRSLVIIKPLTLGLSTNLVLTTTRRVYLIDLVSGRSVGMSTSVAWAYPDAPAPRPIVLVSTPMVPTGEGELSSRRYRIAPQGRRPAWSPVSVFDDGRKTFVAFAPGLDRGPSPLLFVRDAGQAPALVNYRQRGDVYVVDRLFDEAELRLGDRRPEVVRISRVEELAR